MLMRHCGGLGQFVKIQVSRGIKTGGSMLPRGRCKVLRCARDQEGFLRVERFFMRPASAKLLACSLPSTC